VPLARPFQAIRDFEYFFFDQSEKKRVYTHNPIFREMGCFNTKVSVVLQVKSFHNVGIEQRQLGKKHY